MEYIYRAAAFALFGVCVSDGPLPLKAVRNTDFKEILLEVGSQACDCDCLLNPASVTVLPCPHTEQESYNLKEIHETDPGIFETCV